VEERRSQHSSEKDLRDQEGFHAQIRPQAGGVAHMDKPGLRPALEPAFTIVHDYPNDVDLMLENQCALSTTVSGYPCASSQNVAMVLLRDK
jgi:hypothetical protein